VGVEADGDTRDLVLAVASGPKRRWWLPPLVEVPDGDTALKALVEHLKRRGLSERQSEPVGRQAVLVPPGQAAATLPTENSIPEDAAGGTRCTRNITTRHGKNAIVNRVTCHHRQA
jgi:hypothetical protein